MAQSGMKPWANPSSVSAVIAATANARAAPRTSLPLASLARGFESSRGHQSGMSRKPTAATTSSASSAAIAARRCTCRLGSPRPRRTSRLHFRRPWLVQAGCRHFHEERTTLGPRPAQRAEARHLPAWTILPDPAVARWIATDHCDAGLWPISVPWGSCPSRWCRFVVCREGIHWRINPVGVAADWSVGCDGRRE